MKNRYTQKQALLDYIEQMEQRNKELFTNVCKAFEKRNEGVKRDFEALKHNLKIGGRNE